MKPKLALLTIDFAPQIGGVQTYLLEICKRLSANYQIVVITPQTGFLSKDIPIEQITIPSSRLSEFVKQLNQVQANRVLVGHAHPKLLLASLVAPPHQYAAMTYGNDFLAGQKRWHRLLFNYLLNRAQPLLTISHVNVKRLHQLGIKKPLVIHPATDPKRFTPAAQKKSKSPVLLTISRLVPRKGIDITLQAVAQLIKLFPNLQYHIGGTGPDRQRLEKITDELGLTHAVTFLGYIPEEGLPDVYRQANIFVMPAREIESESSVEGFGITYLEASACGLPIVAGQSGGVAEAVLDGQTGYLVEPDNIAMLTEILARLLSNADLCHQLGQNGRRWVETEMNWERAAHQMQLALAAE